MFKVGDVEIKKRVLLGPMAGITTMSYREFMKPFGVGLSFSEMVSDCGIDFNNRRTFEYLKTSKIDTPVAIQLFGFSAENTTKAIKIIENEADFDILDINLGCPVLKVTKTGAGSAWLKDRDKLRAYMKAVCETSSKPVSAKIRLGWDENSINVYEVSKDLEEAGVKLITIHCRTKAQGYSGIADYTKVANMKNVISVPFAISGDIFTPQKAKEAIDITGADAVMVARGGVGNPFLLTQINEYLETGNLLPEPTVKQQAEWALEYAKKLCEEHGESVAMRELRGIIPHFFSGFPGYKKVRVQIASSLTTMNQLEKILEGIKSREHC